MERIPSNPPAIEKISADIERPFWSVMIPVFNSVGTFVETLDSVLQQDPGPEQMQIMVIDDCSTRDDIQGVVEKMGKGRVEYYRKPENEGHVRNYNTCVQMARGHYIHILHADDRVCDEFYEEFSLLLKQFPGADAAFSRWEYINYLGNKISCANLFQDEPGMANDVLEKLAVRLRMQYVTTVVKRAVYEEIGGFYGVNYGEDWLMWCRIAASYQWVYTPKILGQYREHALGSMSMSSIKDGSNIADIFYVMNKTSELLPVEKKDLAKDGFKNYLLWTIDVMKHYWRRTLDDELVHHQISTVLKYTHDIQILGRIKSLKLRMRLKPLYLIKKNVAKYVKGNN